MISHPGSPAPSFQHVAPGRVLWRSACGGRDAAAKRYLTEDLGRRAVGREVLLPPSALSPGGEASGLGSVGVGTGDTLEPLRRGHKATCSYFPVSSGSQNSPVGVTLYPCVHVPPCTRDTLVAVFDLVLVNTVLHVS